MTEDAHAIIREFAYDLNEWRRKRRASFEQAQLRAFSPIRLHERAKGDPELYITLMAIAGYMVRK